MHLLGKIQKYAKKTFKFQIQSSGHHRKLICVELDLINLLSEQMCEYIKSPSPGPIIVCAERI